jgi:hypothetical protein
VLGYILVYVYMWSVLDVVVKLKIYWCDEHMCWFACEHILPITSVTTCVYACVCVCVLKMFKGQEDATALFPSDCLVTNLLKPNLSSVSINCTMLATIYPDLSHYDECLKSLRYASTCKKIHTKKFDPKEVCTSRMRDRRET